MVLALGIGLQPPPDAAVATLLEQAVVEQRCGGLRGVTAMDTEAHEECLRSELASLRGDFGRDLTRLAPTDRRAIDAVCSKIDRSIMREAYIKCLSDQLAVVHNRRTRATPAPAAPAEPPVQAAVAPAPSVAPPPPPAVPIVWIAGGIVALLGVGGIAFFVVKSRKPTHTCRVCGQEVAAAGALCQKCRHEAAEALRSAAHERAEQERAQAEAQRQQKDQEEEHARKVAHQMEAARLQQEEEARHQAERRQEEARLEEEARARHESGNVADDGASPYAILGVAEGADADLVRRAYDEAIKKYDPTLVADMGLELQEHFKAKAEAVERAYRAIAGAPT
jgi:DnaJ-domain-containing protein 1